MVRLMFSFCLFFSGLLICFNGLEILIFFTMRQISEILTEMLAKQEDKFLGTCTNWFSLLLSKIQLLLDKKVEEEVS